MSLPPVRRTLAVNDAPGTFTEDVGTVVDGAAWVLDGATGVTPQRYTDAPSDGYWYVRRVDSYLREHARDDSLPLTDHVANAVRDVRDRFADVAPESVDPAAEPSATGAIVRWTGEALEYFVLCDSSLAVDRGDGDVAFTTDGRIEAMEERALDRMREARREGAGFDEAHESIIPILRENRRRKNTPGAYWVLSFDPDASREALTGRYDVAPETRVLLFTDGFRRLVDTYGVCADWEAAVDAIDRRGVEPVVDELRAVEEADPTAERYPRLKAADDATVVSVEFGETDE